MKYVIFFALAFFPLMFSTVFAEEPILISISSNIDQIIFDGKWTDGSEWKPSSHNKIEFSDGEIIHLRTAHKDNFIYIQVNPTLDKTIDKGADRTTICFDTKNDKTFFPQNDDYCFSSILDRKHPFTYQGGGSFPLNGHFTKISNNKDFVAVGGVSDKNDRYSQQAHPVYEFKIPLELLGRTNNYGFYFEVFDASTYKTYSWPTEINKTNSMNIPSPEQWGNIVSPDKSLPEFSFNGLLYFFIPIIGIFIIITRSNLFKMSILNH